jgi:hypothetical protein
VTREEQEALARGMCDDMCGRIIEDIRTGRIPEHWNGIQLRLLMSERAAGYIMCATPQRKREFRNDCLVHNL